MLRDSTADTNAAFLKCRFCFLLLLDRIWRLYPLLRLILPVPVTRNRLAAALLVFILGTFYSSKLCSYSDHALGVSSIAILRPSKRGSISTLAMSCTCTTTPLSICLP